MMVIMSVDLGKARTGLALCDKTEFLASPYKVIFEKSPKKLPEQVAQAAKEAFDAKAEMLDDVAQETTSQQILQAVGDIDFSELAKQGDDPTATNTAIKQLILDEGIEHAHEYAQEIHEIIGDWNNE